MRKLANDYVSGAESAVRDVYVKIALNDEENTVFEADEIVDLSISRSVTDGSFGIGFTPSDRLSCTILSAEKVKKKTRITVYVRFSASGTWERLGRFYCDRCTRDGSAIQITAFDAMNLQDKLVGFNGVESKELAALDFPCTMQQMLDYIVAYRGLTCEFECQPFTIQKKPLKSETETDKTKKYYTVREMLGFIAAAHGCNAKFDSSGKLYFPPFAEVDTELTASNVLDFSIDDGEPFTASGIYISTADGSVYIDDVPGSEYDEEQAGVIKCGLPFSSAEVKGIAEYIWQCLGGLSYYGGGVKIRGAGILECGDVVKVGNLKFPQDAAMYPFCVTGIRYDISRQDGFIETLTSEITRSAAGGTGGESAGSSYSAGSGINIEKGTISLKPAEYGGYDTWREKIGGVTIVYDAGLHLDNACLSLRDASVESKGGGKIGDGISIKTPVEYGTGGEMIYPPDGQRPGKLAVRLGKGLKYQDNPIATEDYYRLGYCPGEEANEQSEADRKYRGRAITLDLDKGLKINDTVDKLYVNEKGYGKILSSKLALDIGSGITFEEHADSDGKAAYSLAANIGGGLKFEEYTDENGNGLKRIVPNLGQNLEIGADGKINAKGGSSELTPGDGIDIQNNVVSVKVDGDTVKFDGSGALTAASGVTIDKAVIIKEADAKYILHDFKQVEYLAGNKIGYAGAGNQIIVGGYVFYKNEEDIIALGSAPYTSAVFAKAGINAPDKENCDFYMRIASVNINNTNIALASNALNNQTLGRYQTPTYDLSRSGLGFTWSTIHPPSASYPNGYAYGQVRLYVINANGEFEKGSYGSSVISAAFGSIAEYEAAVGLTYEPLTLTRMEDNPTIV